jgi:hypothetical protein
MRPRACQRDEEVVATGGLRWKAGIPLMGAPSAVTHLRKIEGFRWTVPLEIVLSRVVRHQRPSINSPMLQPVLVTELVPDTLAPMSAVRVPWLASRMQKKRRRSDVRSAATPLRRGRRIMVWQTRVLMDDGTLIAVAIQTQMVL